MRCRATCFLLLHSSQPHQPAFIGVFSEEKQSQMSIYSQLLAFCLFLIKPPLTTKMHQPALAGTCVQHLNPKFKTFNVCCMLCKLTQPTSVYFQFTNCIFATSAAFSTFFCISRDVHYIHLADPGEKGKTNHQPSNDATHFLPHQVVRP